jgi:hypothetical protein
VTWRRSRFVRGFGCYDDQNFGQSEGFRKVR